MMLLKFLIALIVCLTGRVTLAALADEAKKSVLCDEIVLSGKIENFEPIVQPKFTREYLEQNRHLLTPKNPDFILGETGASIWYIEYRNIQGQEQIVAVKYLKLEGASEEVTQIESQLKLIHRIFQIANLLKYFDVILPLERGEDYLVFPFIEGVGLSDLTLKRGKHLNPPDKYLNPNIFELGPPREEQDSALAKIWAFQQKGLKEVKQKLEEMGYEVRDMIKGKSWFGVKYIEYFRIVDPKNKAVSIPLRADFIVTTDGRMVMVDPY